MGDVDEKHKLKFYELPNVSRKPNVDASGINDLRSQLFVPTYQVFRLHPVDLAACSAFLPRPVPLKIAVFSHDNLLGGNDNYVVTLPGEKCETGDQTKLRGRP